MKHLLSSTAFIIMNKELARNIGLKEAILLADLISKEEYFINKGLIDAQGFFFNTEANIENDTTLNAYNQRKCLRTLKSHNIIETKRKGIPAKQYFKINEQQVLQILNNLSDKNYTTINKNKEIIINNKLFKKPSVNDVELYCIERCNKIDAIAFVNFYESKGWMIGKSPMKDWRASVRTWEMRHKNKPKTMSKLDAQINAWQEAKKLI